MSPKTPFKKLYYADLYCGDGECHIEKTGESYEPPLIETLLKQAKEGKFRVCCFLNDLNPANINKIKEHTLPYVEFIEDYTSDDANICYKKILTKIPVDQISIFFLDPFNHKQLKWETIKNISEHVCKYKKRDFDQTRRPELIINCMTYTMTGSYMAGDYKTINQSLGTEEWLELIDKYKEEGRSRPIQTALLDTFIKQLQGLGYHVPTPIEIKSTIAQNDVYYLVWATNESGCKIIEDRVIPYLKKTISKKLKDNKIKLVKVQAKEKARKKGDGDINKWMD